MGEIIKIIEYILCAGLVAIGFGSISNVPFKAFKGCAMLGALGYIMRYSLMTYCGIHIILASFVGALSIGVFASVAGRHRNKPAESIAYPALLPMNLGMYAYRAVEGIPNRRGCRNGGCIVNCRSGEKTESRIRQTYPVAKGGVNQRRNHIKKENN